MNGQEVLKGFRSLPEILKDSGVHESCQVVGPRGGRGLR